jgi:hypothetical protein
MSSVPSSAEEESIVECGICHLEGLQKERARLEEIELLVKVAKVGTVEQIM